MDYKKNMFFAILLIHFNISHGQIINDHWKGFRGLGNEGISQCDTLPTIWSDTCNIKWKTRVPGNGFSSPIAYNDNIFLTTSFKTIKGSITNKILQNLLFVVGTLVLILLTLKIRWQLATDLNIKALLYNGLFSIIILLILLLVLFSYNVFDYARCDSRRWVGSSFFLFLSLFSCTFFVNKKKKLKRALGFLIIILIPLFFYFMPVASKEHLFRHGPLANNPIFLYLINIIYFVGALLIIFNIFPTDTKMKLSIENKKERYRKKTILRNSLIYWFINLLLILFLIIISSKIIYQSEYLSYRFGSPLLKPVIEWKSLLVLALFWFIIISVTTYFHLTYILIKKCLYLLKSMVLLLGIFYFIHTNFISVNEKHCRAIVSIDAKNGNVNWICEGLFAPLGSLNMNSPASPTPIADEKYIYGYFGSSGMFCCNYYGKIIWENRNLPFNSYYGVGASPVLYNDKIILVSDSPKKPYISVLNKYSGKEIWRNNIEEGLSSVTAGSSRTPLVKHFKNTDIIFIWRGNKLILLNLIDGNEISSICIEKSKLTDDCVSSLISDSTNIYLSKPDYCIAFNIESLILGDSIPIWKKNIKGSNIPTPVLSNNLLFVLNDRGRVRCIKTTTGDVLWENRLSGLTYFSSPISNNKLVYFTDNYGHTSVIRASKVFELVSENKLDCEIRATIMPFKNNLYLRSYNLLYCISEDEKITMGNILYK